MWAVLCLPVVSGVTSCQARSIALAPSVTTRSTISEQTRSSNTLPLISQNTTFLLSIKSCTQEGLSLQMCSLYAGHRRPGVQQT
jgi:hypothetical protein